jgi:hypothetical protein
VYPKLIAIKHFVNSLSDFLTFTNKIKNTCVYAFVGHHVGTLHKTLPAKSEEIKRVLLKCAKKSYHLIRSWGMLPENLWPFIIWFVGYFFVL